MGHINFKNYLTRFEKEVVLEGVNTGLFSSVQLVSVKNSVMGKSIFAHKMGSIMPYDQNFVVDYYGYRKKSYGFVRKLKEERETIGHRQLKMISAVVVHFNSIKIEDITTLTSSSYLISNFTRFKEMVLEKRGFRNGV